MSIAEDSTGRIALISVSMIYSLCIISTGKQNIERQERNIRSAFPDVAIVRETYTGTRFQGRKELEKRLDKIQPGDTILFDSVSRMSRDSVIRKHNKSFGGSLTDAETMKQAGVSRKSFYKYKRELREEDV